MNYEVAADKKFPQSWRVEAIDFDGDGDCFVTVFDGPDAEKRAREYAAWKESGELGDGEPSPPPKWERQESCSECDGDGCAKCESGAAQEVSPRREPMFIRQIRQSYSLDNPIDFKVTHSEMGELLEFLNASRAEGDTRELKAALRQFKVHLAHMIQNYRCLAEKAPSYERHGDEECNRATAFLKEYESSLLG